MAWWKMALPVAVLVPLIAFAAGVLTRPSPAPPQRDPLDMSAVIPSDAVPSPEPTNPLGGPDPDRSPQPSLPTDLPEDSLGDADDSPEPRVVYPDTDDLDEAAERREEAREERKERAEERREARREAREEARERRQEARENRDSSDDD